MTRIRGPLRTRGALRHPLPNTGIIESELRDSRPYCTEWVGIESGEFVE